MKSEEFYHLKFYDPAKDPGNSATLSRLFIKNNIEYASLDNVL